MMYQAFNIQDVFDVPDTRMLREWKPVPIISVVRQKYGRGNYLTNEIKIEIARLYNEGMTAPKIGAKMNIGRSAVYNALEEKGVKRHSNGHSRNKLFGKEDEVIDAYNKSLSMLEVAKKFGSNEKSIQQLLRKLKVKIRPIGEHDVSKSPNWKGGISRTKEYKRAKSKRFSALYRKTNPLYKLSQALRGRIVCALKMAGYKKNTKTYFLLGASFEVVKGHLEKQFLQGMTWENHGRGPDKWHIDHIIPCAFANTEQELLKLFHYTNLSPLWSTDNYKKSSKHDGVRHYFKERNK